MTISDTGLAFIAQNEGYAAHVYDDEGKQAIGYGHDLLPGESFPDGVTRDEAVALLKQDCAKIESAMGAFAHEGLIPADCTQGQWDALVDFGFNLGAGSLHKLLLHGWEQIPERIVEWHFAGGKPNAGLLVRREKELAMFQSA